MVPDLIKEQFWQLHSSIGSLRIACGQDTVPWELLYPIAPGKDAGFLVEQFPVLRRAYGQCRSQRIAVAPSVFIVPSGSPANAAQEASVLRACSLASESQSVTWARSCVLLAMVLSECCISHVIARSGRMRAGRRS